MLPQKYALGPRRLYLRPSPVHGLGVFAARDIKAGTVLEVSPVIVVPASQVPALESTTLYPYYFRWPDDAAALALGYGSLYNHSYQASAGFEPDVHRRVIVFYAVKPIALHQEVTINYNGCPADQSRVWFDRPSKTFRRNTHEI